MFPDTKSQAFLDGLNFTWGVMTALGWGMLAAVVVALVLLIVVGIISLVYGAIRGS